MNGGPPVYFEAAAAIVTLVLLGQVLELRARSRTGAAIRALLDLAPRPRGLSRMAGKKTFHWSEFISAIGCGCVRARRFRWTAQWSKGIVPWTSP